MTSTITYLGDLRTESTHLQSGEKIVTDAPVDNNGRGEAFSPTDLLATSLGNCMLTIMGMRAKDHGIAIEGTICTIKKVMAANPRRVSEIHAELKFPGNYSDEEKKMLENAALTCPVFYSLHPDIVKDIRFTYEK